LPLKVYMVSKDERASKQAKMKSREESSEIREMITTWSRLISCDSKAVTVTVGCHGGEGMRLRLSHDGVLVACQGLSMELEGFTHEFGDSIIMSVKCGKSDCMSAD
jgi:hypothetical protein